MKCVYIGSTRLATSIAGAILFSTDYQPFGPLYNPSGSSNIDMLYAGKLIDEATGLYYSVARFYDSSSGRFISKDSKSGPLQDPQSLNRYIYARDNPLMFVDPSGHMFILPVLSSYTTTTSPQPAPSPAPSTVPVPVASAYVHALQQQALSPQPASTPSSAPAVSSYVHALQQQAALSTPATTSSSSSALAALQLADQRAEAHDSMQLVMSRVSGTGLSRAAQADSCSPSGFNCEEAGSIGLAGVADIGTGIAVGLTGGYILATPLGFGLVDGDIHATSYVLINGQNAKVADTWNAFEDGFVEGFLLYFGFGQ